MRLQQCCMCDQQRLRPACAYAQSDQSLCYALQYSMIVKLLTEHRLERLSLKGGCRGSSESTHVKMPHCWKSHALVQMFSSSSVSLLLSFYKNILDKFTKSCRRSWPAYEDTIYAYTNSKLRKNCISPHPQLPCIYIFASISFMHIFNMSPLWRESIRLMQQKLW